MSRTYRKNHRWIEKYQGEYYRRDYRSPSIKYPFGIKECDFDLPWGTAWSRVEVLVGDGDNWRSCGVSSDVKQLFHQIDRARYKQALLRNEDTHIRSSFDPWDWD
jgi:hypothetical protein